ncbi:MAG: hypothetical protein J7619_12745 [Dyadobacter sp.]|uniref:hypothetical protein n=1 Tax=Dyadobacter sp. TaxID=1914288 RepID=UPI001B27E9F1|nr:hypothetical protein [Dyadobacter sp.]MBO9613563.1 hypothetical protein [Dyadobacter sp.]
MHELLQYERRKVGHGPFFDDDHFTGLGIVAVVERDAVLSLFQRNFFAVTNCRNSPDDSPNPAIASPPYLYGWPSIGF